MTLLEAPAYLSPSSIETFQICPLKYKLSRIDHLSEPPGEAAILGNYTHDVFEEILKLPPEERTLFNAKSVMAFVWSRTDEENPISWGERIFELVSDDAELRKFRWRSWWCVENWFKMESPAEIDYGGLETKLDTSIEGVPIKGFIDRWDHFEEGFNIVDYKTGKTPAPKYQDKKFQQLFIYATALADNLNLEPKKATLLFVKDGVALTQNVTPVAIRKTKELVRNIYDGVLQRCEAGHFEPKMNNLCKNWCSYKPICPLWK